MQKVKSTFEYDGKIDISVGTSRKCIAWKNKSLLWSRFVQRLSKATRTAETGDEYKNLSKTERANIKDVGGFVGGTLNGSRRNAGTIQDRSLITLDIDTVPRTFNVWVVVELALSYAAVMYSTHSHTDASQRYRLIMPISRKVSPDEYMAISALIANDIGIDMCDDSTFEASRLMYWPSVSADAEYIFKYIDAPWINADEQLKRYTNWQDPAEWPVSSRKKKRLTVIGQKQENPCNKKGLVGAFCRVYSIDDAINTFLSDIYSVYDDNRYTYQRGSTVGGLVVYEDGKFAYSHHSTDPASGRLCNAFDLVRLHKFSSLDVSAAQDTPVNRLPSYKAMCDFAAKDKTVAENLTAYNLASVTEALTATGEGTSKDWLNLLTLSSKGLIEPTIENVLIIMQNDNHIKSKYYYDSFRERPIVCGDLPWQRLDKRISNSWTDADDAGLRLYLEKFYKISNAVKIRDAVELAMLDSIRHPIREYFNSLTWDGNKRAETVFIEYLGAADTEYTREVTRKALIGAVARIMEPGCKHDHVLVLVGPQGCRKSTTLAKLGKDWFSDSLYTVTGKEAYEQLQGYWIIELGEMAATKKADIEQLKLFVSKTSDNYRAAYAKRTQEHPRQCAFFGTTNDNEFLRDATGSRRFWPVIVTEKGKTEGDKLTDEIVDQIWAESLTYYQAGEPWYLSASSEKEAQKVQKACTERDSKQGLIENFLDLLLPLDWMNKTLEERLLFWDGGFSGKEEGTVLRTKVCAIEIWQELFHGDPKNFTPLQARNINNILRQLPNWRPASKIRCGKIYGSQRGFTRIGGTQK